MQGFPYIFWDDVVNTVVYLINIGPSSALDVGIPKEAWNLMKYFLLLLK